jgi:hypothetical protein
MHMKRISLAILILVVVVVTDSCSKKDNFDEPEETLTGSVIDVTTGKPIQIESGGGGVQIRYHDLTWGQQTGNTVLPRDFNVKPDGTFNNTKMFEGDYKIYPFNGAFVPVYSENAGAPVDNSKTVFVKGVTTVNFVVEPLLKIEWVEEPVLNADRTVTAKFKFTRGTANPVYTAFAPTDAWLFVSTTPFASNASRNSNMSNSITYTATQGNAALGTTVTITSKAAFPLDAHRTYYVRVGARTADNIQKRYNYAEGKTVVVP